MNWYDNDDDFSLEAWLDRQEQKFQESLKHGKKRTVKVDNQDWTLIEYGRKIQLPNEKPKDNVVVVDFVTKERVG